MIDGAYDYSTKQRREKGMSSKISFPCPQSVKGYNKGRGGLTFWINLYPPTVLTEALKLGTTFVFSLICGHGFSYCVHCLW